MTSQSSCHLRSHRTFQANQSYIVRLCLKTTTKINKHRPGLVAHVFNASTQEAEAGRSNVNLRPTLVYVASSRQSRDARLSQNQNKSDTHINIVVVVCLFVFLRRGLEHKAWLSVRVQPLSRTMPTNHFAGHPLTIQINPKQPAKPLGPDPAPRCTTATPTSTCRPIGAQDLGPHLRRTAPRDVTARPPPRDGRALGSE